MVLGRASGFRGKEDADNHIPQRGNVMLFTLLEFPIQHVIVDLVVFIL